MTSDVVVPAAETTAANGHGDAHSTAGFKALMLGSIGVVYGDIGTSPLYAFREAVIAASGPAGTVIPPAVLGVLSLILWALIIVVTLKYVLILLRADNHGEGGTLALMALAQRAVTHGAGAIVLLGIVSGALFYGDAVITPALSVLSAIEGIKLVTSAFDPYVVPLTVIILLVLFAVQSRGTARVAAFFGPVMCIWFARHRDRGDSPDHAASRSVVCAQSAPRRPVHDPSWRDRIRHARRGVSRGHRRGGALCRSRAFRQTADPDRVAVHCAAVAGAELSGAGRAGHRRSEGGREPVLPDVSGLGVDADGLLSPRVATVIASQAVITGAYSLTRQAIQLGLLPRFEIRHTSESHSGQIYIPRINMLLLISVMLLVLMFRSSSALASAYGISVTGTMVVTAMMGFVVIWKVWKWSPFAAAALIAPFLFLDLHLPGGKPFESDRGRLGAAGAGRRW